MPVSFRSCERLRHEIAISTGSTIKGFLGHSILGCTLIAYVRRHVRVQSQCDFSEADLRLRASQRFSVPIGRDLAPWDARSACPSRQHTLGGSFKVQENWGDTNTSAGVPIIESKPAIMKEIETPLVPPCPNSRLGSPQARGRFSFARSEIVKLPAKQDSKDG